jgi:hypothetical protein
VRVHQRALVSGLLLLELAVAPGFAQETAARPEVAGSELEIYVMTMGVGAEIWERFGHNAIGVRDRSRGTDLVYNYGTFDFTAPGFVTNFLQGRMTYWLDVADAEVTTRFYQERRHRSVYIQELNLPPSMRLELRQFLERNALEENKFYRYDYFRDNCSTRVRDALDRLLGGTFKTLTDTAYAGATYRSHTRRLTTNNPFMYTAIETGMGHPVDRPISAWEEMFLPLAVREHLRRLTIPGDNGIPVPLVRAEHTVYESDVYSFREAPPFWVPWYLLIGVALGGLSLYLATRGSDRRAARTAFLALGTFWYLLMGVGGLILLGLWGFTDHLVTRNNENVLQLSLLALPLAVLLPLGLRRGGNWGRAALRLSLVVTVLALAGLLLKIVPGFHQPNLEIIALALPTYLGLTGGLFHLLRMGLQTPGTPSLRQTS